MQLKHTIKVQARLDLNRVLWNQSSNRKPRPCQLICWRRDPKKSMPYFFFKPPSHSSLCRPLQSMVLLLHSQRQYIFDYDSGDRLSAVTMPSVARHTMQTIRSIGYYRNMYTPPESNASVTVDYSEDGQVGLQTPSSRWIPACLLGETTKMFCFVSGFFKIYLWNLLWVFNLLPFFFLNK